MTTSQNETISVDTYTALFKQSQKALKQSKRNDPLQVCVESESQHTFESRIRMRDFELTIDQPVSFGGTNKGPKPSEILLASLAACQEVTWRLYAAVNGIPLTSIRVDLKGFQDLRGFLDVDDEICPGFQKIIGTVRIETPASDKEIGKLKKIVDAHCPVLDDLRRPVPVKLDVECFNSGTDEASA